MVQVRNLGVVVTSSPQILLAPVLLATATLQGEDIKVATINHDNLADLLIHTGRPKATILTFRYYAGSNVSIYSPGHKEKRAVVALASKGTRPNYFWEKIISF